MTEAATLMEPEENPKLHLLLALAFLAVVVGGVTDLALDAPRSWRSAHVLFEIGLIALALGLALYLWTGWRRASQSLSDIRQQLTERAVERDRWRASTHQLLEGLGHAIARQFGDWQLTDAERDVALQLLKGFTHKEIAAATDRSERTVRQHAVAVYRKAGLSGRAALAAFFLGDLLLPGSGARGARDDAGLDASPDARV
jgi:DNA-binding CsgD family transcriptional regulator